MLGIQLKRAIPKAIAIGVEQGIIFNHAGNDVIRLLPPIILTHAQADILVEKMVNCFRQF
jgi:acetylornithine/succinyldiaminopimelate/putrescine aminotransferase